MPGQINTDKKKLTMYSVAEQSPLNVQAKEKVYSTNHIPIT